MNLRARIEKLERAISPSERCPWCLFKRPSIFFATTTSLARQQAEGYFTFTCEFCGCPYTEKVLADPFLREVMREHRSYTIDQNYTDRRARALYQWVRGAKAVIPLPSLDKPIVGSFRVDQKGTPNERRRGEVLRAANDFSEEQHARCRDLYGTRFPDLDALASELTEKHYPPAMQWAERRTSQLEALAKLESILWGEPRDKTLDIMAEHQKTIQERIRQEATEKALRSARDACSRFSKLPW